MKLFQVEIASRNFGNNEALEVLWFCFELTLNVPCISESYIAIKIKLKFYFTLLCGPSKGFMKAFKAFISPFETPQRSVKIKI